MDTSSPFRSAALGSAGARMTVFSALSPSIAVHRWQISLFGLFRPHGITSLALWGSRIARKAILSQRWTAINSDTKEEKPSLANPGKVVYV
jgi:hypothetical protein